jgi:hypothetical protein
VRLKKGNCGESLFAARLILLIPAVRVAIIATLNNVIQLLKRRVHPQVIPTVVSGKEITGFRVKCNIIGIAQAGCIDFAFTGLREIIVNFLSMSMTSYPIYL